MAVSAEKDLSKKHDIVLDGYNLGRDYLVGNLTQQTIRASSRYITPETNDVAIVNQEIGYYGMKTLDSITYKTTVRYVSRQSENTSGRYTPTTRSQRALLMRSFSRLLAQKR